MNRFAIKLLALCVMYALCVGYVFAADAEKSPWSLQLHGLSWHAESRAEFNGIKPPAPTKPVEPCKKCKTAQPAPTPTQPAPLKWNEFNVGLGLRYTHSDDLSTQFGLYKNSIDKTTVYALATYTPIDILGARVGVFGGLASGYSKPVIAGGAVEVGPFTLRVIPRIKGVTPWAVGIELGVPL
jgi:hypothetical protein